MPKEGGQRADRDEEVVGKQVLWNYSDIVWIWKADVCIWSSGDKVWKGLSSRVSDTTICTSVVKENPTMMKKPHPKYKENKYFKRNLTQVRNSRLALCYVW